MAQTEQVDSIELLTRVTLEKGGVGVGGYPGNG